MKHFIFDWDGTLANTLDVWLEFFKSLFKELGIEITSEEIVKNVFGGMEFIKLYNLEAHLDLINKRFDEVYVRLQSPPLFEGVKELLENLSSQGAVLSIVTSSGHLALDSALKSNDISQFFKAVICADDVVNLKPDPEPILKAISLTNLSAENSIMIGDSPKDLIAAHAAKVKCGIFYSPLHSSFNSKKIFEDLNADYFFSNILEVADLL